MLPHGNSEPYTLLGLAKPSINNKYDLKDIRQAYRRKALELHPDKNPDKEAAEKFNRLAVVLEYLSNEENRNKYDEFLFEHERRIQRFAAQDIEKKRLAAELKRREIAYAESKARESDASFLKRNFRGASSASDSKHWERLRQQAELDRIVLREKEKLIHQSNTSTGKKTKQYDIDSTHFYILSLHWHPEEKGMGSNSMKVLEILLQPFSPYSIQKCDCAKGLAYIQFLSQAQALEAAMAFTMLEDDSVLFKTTGLSSFVTFSARVVKKPRVSKRGHISRNAADEEEDARLIEQHLNSVQPHDEASHCQAHSETGHSNGKKKSVKAEIDESFSSSSSEVKVKNVPPVRRPIAPSLLARLNLVTVAPTVPLIDSETPGASSEILIDDSDEEVDELEAKTLQMLKQVVNRKKARLA